MLIAKSSTRDCHLFLDETTTSIDSREEQGVDQDTDGHDQNVTHKDNARKLIIQSE